MTAALSACIERELDGLTRKIERANNAGHHATERALLAQANQLLSFYHSALGLNAENSRIAGARFFWFGKVA
jgi:hypothetical protein